jgi:hypothetical protein
MVVTAFLLLTLALASLLGVMVLRRQARRHSDENRPIPAVLLILARSKPARPRPTALAAAGQLLRAPPTFPDQPLIWPSRLSSGD